MKSSNVTYVSNVYVYTGSSKLADATFMSHVIDPVAIRESGAQHRKFDGLTGQKSIQQIIYENAMPCSYGNGDFTHGSIIENGQLICVNKCENIDCELYPKCSACDDFRLVERDADATFIFTKPEPKPEPSPIMFVTPAPTVRKFKRPETKIVIQQIEEIVQRNRDAKQWGVRGFIRHLANGTTTWVRGHIRGHDASTDLLFRTVKKKSIAQINRGKLRALSSSVAHIRLQCEPLNIPQTYQLKNIKRIDSAEQIINSGIESRILVNAGPGTGKTHTVIERLKFLAKQEDEISPNSVFVLCFSRSAVRVINDRLDEAIKSHEIPLSAKQFNVATFDSFATWFLKEGEPNYDLSPLNYDERIRRFINIFKNNPTDLDNAMEYLIVDEVQDLVGDRAMLVKSLLEQTSHGFLLLGDECQAIYDYQITAPNEFNASKLYEWLENHFGSNLEEYELTRNHRSKERIGKNLKSLRSAMLFRPFNEQKSVAEELFKTYNPDGMDVDEILQCCESTNETQAILSWSNGDAYRQSSDLYSMDDKSFTHKILTGARRLSYRRELADILSGYTNSIISKNKFRELAKAKKIDEAVAQSLWEGFAKVLDDDISEIDLKQLRNLLVSERRVADSLLCPEDATLTISTIHKAKGKEYDTVLVKQSGISKGEDIKVYYVAMTRAKKELIVKPKTSRHRDRKMESGRFVEIRYNEIKRIELGIDGDIDPISFVLGENPAERQEYIATQVKPGDKITISKHDGKYYIVHDGHYIGEIRPEIFKDWRHQESYQKWAQTYRLSHFTDFEDLFVSDIVTIVNTKLDGRMSEKHEEYKKCGFWYGIEFCGYAMPREE